MKKLLSATMLLILLIVLPAFAEIDLSGMTFDELVSLKEKINLAMWECEEWQEVLVPQGIYEIGKDIPSGKWTIRVQDNQFAQLSWGTCYNDKGDAIKHDIDFDQIFSESSSQYRKDDPLRNKTFVDYNLKDGQYLEVRFGQVIFTTYSGHDLGFTFN